MIDIKKLSEQDLKQKIKNIKIEREKTDNALKKYEEELERRNNKVPLGVPLEDQIDALLFGDYHFGFNSFESEHVFCERLKEYVEALRKLAKGEHIDIKVLLPLLQKGFVAMDKDGNWFWYSSKPKIENNGWNLKGVTRSLWAFDIQPVEDWKHSLMECGL